MSKLDDLLAIEEKAFRNEQYFFMQFAVNVRGLRKEHLEPLIQSHLRDCAEYYKIHGTIDGELTPWMVGKRV